MNFPCPNCGQLLSAEPTDVRLSCRGCGEELVRSDDGKKMLLANPLSTYLDKGGEAARVSELWDKADQAEGLIDLRRRQATVEMSAKWLGQRLASGNRYLKIGAGLLIFCTLLLMLALVRTLVLGYIQLDAFVSFIGASLLAPFGFFFLVWPLVDRLSLSKYAARIREERQILIEEERTFRN